MERIQFLNIGYGNVVSANRVTIFVTIEGVLSSDKGLTIYLFF